MSHSSFNFACIASFRNFSLLWRARLAPFQSENPLSAAIKGNKVSDGLAETFSWYSQSKLAWRRTRERRRSPFHSLADWPTVILLIPRAGLSLALLLLFGTTAYGSSTIGATDRDSAYFNPNGTLTGFAQGFLLA